MAEPDDVFDKYDMFDPDDLERQEQAMAREGEVMDNDLVKYLERKQRAYKSVFSTGHTNQEDLDIVLNDLQWFCRMQASTFNPKDGPHRCR